MDLNFLERTLARVAPGWGLQRLGHKVALHQARAFASTIEERGFDAAKRNRRTEGWIATGGSANAELGPALDTVRRRSRDLCRNNEWGVNARRKWVSHMVGTGIVPRPIGVAGQAKKVAREAWASFVETADPAGRTDHYGQQAQVAGEVFEGGAAFIRWYLRPPSFGLKVPLQCEVLEHDYLDTRRTERHGDNIVLNGVEFDQWGRRAAYWLYDVHPGEIAMISRGSMQSRRVPVDECDHVFRVDRAGQVTGVPWLAAAMLRLRDIADYEEAELVRKKIEACFTVFVRRGGAVQGLAQSADQKTDSQGRRLERISPGLVTYVDGEGEVTTAQPTAAGDTGYINRQLYGVAAGVGLTHSSASGDLSNVNFTSLREGKLDFWPTLDQVQWHMLSPQMCRPAWRRVMKAAAGRGLQVSPDTAMLEAMPKRPWVNPADDMRAEAGEIAMALESWADKVAARGHDPEALLEEIKEWRQKLEDAGLDPNVANSIVGAKAAPTPTDTPPAEPPKPAPKPGKTVAK
ncbi:phage portal protein [Reyranella sp.]|uniref:phage portal protein n=1 Tax=Reyranella sp. TaxID=1929291 RepID=UPI003D0FBB58